MKTLLVILVLDIVVGAGSYAYMSRSIDQIIAQQHFPAYVLENAQTGSESLTIEDTGFNSATDALQTAAGIDVYQNAADVQ